MPTLDHADLLQLRRWNTPTIYNGWEQMTRHDAAADGFNLEPTTDFMPQMGPMVGYAVTVQSRPSDPAQAEASPNAWVDYRAYVASVPGPKVVVLQDLDKPGCVGSFWGEVNASVHMALGCVGTITDGAVRDVDEMTAAGFKALARRMCVGHAHAGPVSWGVDVEVFGRTVRPGQLIHADKHGFLAVPSGEENGLLDAAVFMDRNECETLIAAARSATGKATEKVLAELDEAAQRFGAAAARRFRRRGEWS